MRFRRASGASSRGADLQTRAVLQRRSSRAYQPLITGTADPATRGDRRREEQADQHCNVPDVPDRPLRRTAAPYREGSPRPGRWDGARPSESDLIDWTRSAPVRCGRQS